MLKGLVDCVTLDEFEKTVDQFYSQYSLDKDLVEFIQYFKAHKETLIKYYVTQSTISSCELTGNPNKFNVEAMNSVLKKMAEL